MSDMRDKSGEDGLAGFGEGVLLRLGLTEIRALGGEVGLDLGLGAGGAHDDGGAVLQLVDEDVCLGQTGLLGLCIVRDGDDGDASKVLRGVLAQTGHDAGHLVHAAETRELKGVDLVEVAAESVNLFSKTFLCNFSILFNE